jgi:hypothetical protein
LQQARERSKGAKMDLRYRSVLIVDELPGAVFVNKQKQQQKITHASVFRVLYARKRPTGVRFFARPQNFRFERPVLVHEPLAMSRHDVLFAFDDAAVAADKMHVVTGQRRGKPIDVARCDRVDVVVERFQQARGLLLL